MNSEQDTLPNLQTVLDAINNLQQETNEQFAEVRQEMNARFNQINLRLDEHDNRFEQMRLEMMSFDARLDRLQATARENLNIAYNLRADVKFCAKKSLPGRKMSPICN